MKPLSILFSMIAILVLTGCGDDDEDEPTTITWVTNTDESPISTDEEVAAYIQEQIEEIEEEHNVVIQTDIHTENIDEAMARLEEQASIGEAPDVALMDGFTLERFHQYLQPLDEHIEAHDMDIDDYLPFAQESMYGEDGRVYGLYQSTDVRHLFYDSTVISEPPETWDETMEIADELVSQGYEGLALPLGIDEGTTITSLLPMFWGQGGELIDEDGRVVFGEGENREYMLNVFESIQEGVEDGYIPQRMAVEGSEDDASESEIAAGIAPMVFAGSYQMVSLSEIIGDDMEENWEVASLPTLGDSDPTTGVGGWAWGIFTEDEQKQEAIFDFLKSTFVGQEAMAEFTSLRDTMPVRDSVYDMEDFDGPPFSEEHREILEEEGMNRPANPEYSSISVQLQTAISHVVSGSKTPEDALDDAWEIVTFGEGEDE